MKEIRGSFTVEASILVPVLMTICVVFVYLGIYAYDKTLMIQDVNSLAVMIRDENADNGQDVTAICGEAFSEIKNEHPYLSADNIKMDVSVNGKKVHVILSAYWRFPLYKGFCRTITAEREIKRINPAEKMYLTEIVKSAIKGENDDDTDDVRD